MFIHVAYFLNLLLNIQKKLSEKFIPDVPVQIIQHLTWW